jgi:death on curing protein
MRLSKDDVVQIHDRLIAQRGGTSGVRNEWMIEYAVATAGRKKDPVFEAASILELIGKNRPFLDGNRRTAFASAAMILRSEGHEVVASDEDEIGFMREVAENHLTLTQIAVWLKDRLKKLE